MTLQQQMATDLAAIYDAVELSLSAVYTQDGIDSNVKVIQISGGFMVRKSEISQALINDTITVSGVVWTVKHVVGESEPSGISMIADTTPTDDFNWTLLCSKDGRLKS